MDLNASIWETHKLLRRLIPANIDVIPVLPPDLGKVRADPAQIQQILINLEPCPNMPSRSLLLSRHSATVQFITRGFKEFSVEVESHSEADAALQNLKDQRFEAIVVDAADRDEAMMVLDNLKTLPPCKNSLRIVLADQHTALAAAFSTGTHLVIYKPISADRLRNSLRALCNLMGRRHEREFERIRVRVPAIVHIADKNLPAAILDISETGVALSTQQAMPTTKSLGLEFALPGGTRRITTSAALVWNDVRGRVGAQFVNMEPASRKILCESLASQLSSTRLNKAIGARSQPSAELDRSPSGAEIRTELRSGRVVLPRKLQTRSSLEVVSSNN